MRASAKNEIRTKKGWKRELKVLQKNGEDSDNQPVGGRSLKHKALGDTSELKPFLGPCQTSQR